MNYFLELLFVKLRFIVDIFGFVIYNLLFELLVR